MSETIEKVEAVDVLEVQSWLTGWGDFCNRERVGSHLGYKSPMAKILRNNVQQSRERSRPVLWNMDDQAYYTLIESELAGMRQSGDLHHRSGDLEISSSLRTIRLTLHHRSGDLETLRTTAR